MTAFTARRKPPEGEHLRDIPLYQIGISRYGTISTLF